MLAQTCDDFDESYLLTKSLPLVAIYRLAVTLVADLLRLRLATARELGLTTSVLDREDSALDGVDENVLGLEVRVVAPCAEELNSLRACNVSVGPLIQYSLAVLTPSSSGWTSKKPVSSMLWPAGS